MSEIVPRQPQSGKTTEEGLAEPLRHGYRPYEVNTRGGVFRRERHTYRLIENFPTTVPSGDGGLTRATLLERAQFSPTAEYARRTSRRTIFMEPSKFEDIPKEGPWEIRPPGGPLTPSFCVIMERVIFGNEIVATISPGEIDRYERFYPIETYTLSVLGGLTLRDWGDNSLKGRASPGEPQQLDGEPYQKFMMNMAILQNPECFTPESPAGNRLPIGLDQNNRFTKLPLAAISWIPAGRPDEIVRKA